MIAPADMQQLPTADAGPEHSELGGGMLLGSLATALGDSTRRLRGWLLLCSFLSLSVGTLFLIAVPLFQH